MFLVVGQRGDDNLYVIAQVFGKERADGTIGEAADEDGCLVGASLAAEEAAGDASCGVEPFLVVYS